MGGVVDVMLAAFTFQNIFGAFLKSDSTWEQLSIYLFFKFRSAVKHLSFHNPKGYSWSLIIYRIVCKEMDKDGHPTILQRDTEAKYYIPYSSIRHYYN